MQSAKKNEPRQQFSDPMAPAQVPKHQPSDLSKEFTSRSEADLSNPNLTAKYDNNTTGSSARFKWKASKHF